ncbi:MAG: CehA/McbA family metallohydrolase [Nitrospirae bacterium]|nr:CehA/McbA family metallohydrolase [Nitrospirota bacterium]
MTKLLKFTVFLTLILLFFTPVSAEVYWGDIHVHTSYSSDAYMHGSIAIPDDVCSAAKNNGLNFAAVTDHAEYNPATGRMSEYFWNDTVAQLQNGNCIETSTFIPFLGYEWTNQTYGHKSVIFRILDIPFSAVFGAKHYTTPDALWSALDSSGYKAITIPHHVADNNTAATNWDYHNPYYQPVMEIYSEHGSSESCRLNYELPVSCNSNGSAAYALATKGYKIGIIAGTDAHDGRAGSVYNADSVMSRIQYNGGLIAVITSSLSRANIWEAIKNRHTYATSGPKIILSFNINGNKMGSDVILASGEYPALEISAQGADSSLIDHIDIIKNGSSVTPVHTQTFSQNAVSYSWTDADYISGDFYYVRVIQRNNERAWSSPIWVTTQQ